jgi:hypothetical protein
MKNVIVCLILMTSSFLQAQHISNQEQAVTYDPSFWKKELRLDNSQYRRMCEINFEFYNNLIVAFRSMKDDRVAFRSVFAQYWGNRNAQLIQTMNERQRRKWRKIMSDQQPIDNIQAYLKMEHVHLFTSMNHSPSLQEGNSW